jgi:hypothetical protein
MKPLGEGRVATFILNTANTGGATATFSLAALNISGAVSVRDVWAKKVLAPVAAGGSFTSTVGHHASQFVVFVGAGAKWPVPFELAPWMRKATPAKVGHEVHREGDADM